MDKGQYWPPPQAGQCGGCKNFPTVSVVVVRFSSVTSSSSSFSSSFCRPVLLTKYTCRPADVLPLIPFPFSLFPFYTFSCRCGTESVSNDKLFTDAGEERAPCGGLSLKVLVLVQVLSMPSSSQTLGREYQCVFVCTRSFSPFSLFLSFLFSLFHFFPLSFSLCPA